MLNKLILTIALGLSIGISQFASAGTVGIYRVGENEIIAVDSTQGETKVTIPAASLHAILQNAKPGETVDLAGSEWEILDSKNDSNSLPLKNKLDNENQINIVSPENAPLNPTGSGHVDGNGHVDGCHAVPELK